MRLFGFREMLDNRYATIVTAADDVGDYELWCSTVAGQDPAVRNFNEIYTSTFMDHMVHAVYKGYKHPIVAFYHNDEMQRDAFVKEWDIQEVKSETAKDRHLDMMHKKKVAIEEATETDEDRNRTIGERLGLDTMDRWDRRSDEEKEADRKQKEQMKKLIESGAISGDGSFDPMRAKPMKPVARSAAIQELKDIYEGEDEVDFDSMSNEDLGNALDSEGVAHGTVYDDDKMPAEEVTRSAAIKELKECHGETESETVPDFDSMTNAQLAEALDGISPDGPHSVPRPVIDDVSKEDLTITDIKGSTDDDGTFSIDSVLARKFGGEVDTDLKEARIEAHEAAVDKAKDGKRAFSPDDFAAVLRGDGSSDVVGAKGDDRAKREAKARPTLSDHAEAERKAYQEDEKRRAKEKAKQRRKEDDIKAKADRDKGIFRGVDLVGDDDVVWDELPEAVRTGLESAGLKREEYPLKDYPYNSELGGRALLPFDGIMTPNRVQVFGGDNLKIEGTVSMGEPGVMIASKEKADEPAWAVYVRAPRKEEVLADVWLVRIR